MVKVVRQVILRHIFLDRFRNGNQQRLILNQNILMSLRQCILQVIESRLLTERADCGGGGCGSSSSSGSHGRLRAELS